ncbi:hypothetical protein GEMRC1_003154 [Eukaryota sp. GEM-RC1]
MIRAVLIINNNGIIRLAKFYERLTDSQQQDAAKSIFKILSARTSDSCNFVEELDFWGSNVRLVYRHYATLYFAVIIDEAENELAVLDLIQIFVESLDKLFESICELDIIFNSEKVYFLLDEIIVGGLVVETSLKGITAAAVSANRLASKSK